MGYFTQVHTTGVALYDDLPVVVTVAPSASATTPSGVAFKMGWNSKRQALWQIKIRGRSLPGWWRLVDGEFVAEGGLSPLCGCINVRAPHPRGRDGTGGQHRSMR